MIQIIQKERVWRAEGNAAGAASGRPDTPCHTLYIVGMGTALAALVQRGSGCSALWLGSAENRRAQTHLLFMRVLRGEGLSAPPRSTEAIWRTAFAAVGRLARLLRCWPCRRPIDYLPREVVGL